MVATRDAFEEMWEREYAAALGCEFCDPNLMAQQLLELRKRLAPPGESTSEPAPSRDDDEEESEREPARTR